jgi:hypothetical protein
MIFGLVSSVGLLILLSCRVTFCQPVRVPAGAEPLDDQGVLTGAECMGAVQDGDLTPFHADANNGIVINVEGCYDDASLGLAIAYFPPVLANDSEGAKLPKRYNITWVQPNYFPSFDNEPDFVFPDSSSASTTSERRNITPSDLLLFASGKSFSSSLLGALHELQNLCAVRCQAVLFPSGNSVVNNNRTTSYDYSFRFVLAYGNCYCLPSTSASSYAHLNPSTSLPCCMAAPDSSLRSSSNWTALFPTESAPRCPTTRVYGVLHTAQLACSANPSRCGRSDSNGSYSCRVEQGCCVQNLPLAAVVGPAGGSMLAAYLVTLIFTLVALQMVWWTFRWRLQRERARHRGREADNDGEPGMPTMEQLQVFLLEMQPPPLQLTASRTKDEANEAALEAISLLEHVPGDAVPREDCCPMCLDELAVQPCVQVLCGHIIHTACMHEFLSHKLVSYFSPVTCPMCRATVLVQQRVEDPPPETEVAHQQVSARRRRHRFRHLSAEEIARANLIIAQLLERHRQPGDSPELPQISTNEQGGNEGEPAAPRHDTVPDDDVSQWEPHRALQGSIFSPSASTAEQDEATRRTMQDL